MAAHALVVAACNGCRSGWRFRHRRICILNRDKIPGPNQWISLLSAPAETDSKLSFSGDRVGRSEMAPLLKICVTKDAVLEADSDRETDPANCFNL
jgi:hypothetical protein